jgi:hypothetical protein
MIEYLPIHHNSFAPARRDTDFDWGDKVHGGRVMRWIGEAAFVCGAERRTTALITGTAGLLCSENGGVLAISPVPVRAESIPVGTPGVESMRCPLGKCKGISEICGSCKETPRSGHSSSLLCGVSP